MRSAEEDEEAPSFQTSRNEGPSWCSRGDTHTHTVAAGQAAQSMITSAVHVTSVGDAATWTRDSAGWNRLGTLASIFRDGED